MHNLGSAMIPTWSTSDENVGLALPEESRKSWDTRKHELGNFWANDLFPQTRARNLLHRVHPRPDQATRHFPNSVALHIGHSS